VADGAGAAVAISAIDRFPFVRDAQGGDPGLPEGRACAASPCRPGFRISGQRVLHRRVRVLGRA
jgi:hypothetical protein